MRGANSIERGVRLHHTLGPQNGNNGSTAPANIIKKYTVDRHQIIVMPQISTICFLKGLMNAQIEATVPIKGAREPNL